MRGSRPMPLIRFEEVARHTSPDDCWVALGGKVYNMTSFLPDHPGGPQIIIKNAGKDVTRLFEATHPAGTLEKYLPKECYLGDLDASSVPDSVKQAQKKEEEEEKARRANVPPMAQCLNLNDFEAAGRQAMSPEAWAYYSSAADDEHTLRENRNVFERIWFRPRILRNVKEVDCSTQLLGYPSSMPVYITATALGRLGHPDGELNLTRGAARSGVIQMVPTLSSCSFDEIVQERRNGLPLQFFQLYVNSDRKVVLDMLRRAEEADIKAIFVTVDAPQLGRREKDMRMHFGGEGSNVQGGTVEKRDEGAARAISTFIDPSFDWDDLLFITRNTRLPVLLKGVQTWEDVVLACEMGLAGVVLSNHGGRQLNFAPPAIAVLEEAVHELKKRHMFPNKNFQLFVDGGFRRGTDVLKAIALGATAVGVGRPLLYAYSAYGSDGVVRALELLRDEIEMDMRLLGARTLQEVVPEMLDLRAMHARGAVSHL